MLRAESMIYELRPDEIIEGDEDDWDPDELDCTFCGGEGIEENDDPLWYDGDWITCRACGGSGKRSDQTLF
jgi:DnaJ-class molecular chaperone